MKGMNITISQDESGVTCSLTTDSPSSHYGVPVVRFHRLDYPDCGPGDPWPPLEGMLEPMLVGEYMAGWLQEPGRTGDEISAARLFLGLK